MEKFEKDYTVKVYECDRDRKLNLHNFFNILQDIADIHAAKIGVGYDFCVANGIGWVGANYDIKINRMPRWNEKIRLLTWPSAKTMVSGIREFQAVTENDEPLFCASSQWALVSLRSHRPVAISKYLPDYEPLNERMIDTTFAALPVPERVDFTRDYFILYDDIDLNNHVNNAIYPIWAADAVPAEFRTTHSLSQIQIAFKKPALADDKILVQTQIDGLTTIHRIVSKDDETKEFARIVNQWISEP